MARGSGTAEGHISHGTVGRINVERGEQSVTLRLWQWSLKPDATLSFEEAGLLVRRIQDAMGPKSKATVPVASEEDNFDDIA